jgi:hypothetical protein
MFCGNHEEYRTPPHVEGDIYKTACAIPRRLCQSPLVEAARPHEPHLVPRTIRSTAWMTPCDFEQGRGSSDLAARDITRPARRPAIDTVAPTSRRWLSRVKSPR